MLFVSGNRENSGSSALALFENSDFVEFVISLFGIRLFLLAMVKDVLNAWHYTAIGKRRRKP